MFSPHLTKGQRQSCAEALVIINPGGVNPRAITNALYRVYDEWSLYGTDGAQHAPPAVLILTQLCGLAGVSGPTLDEFTAAKDFCKRNAPEVVML